LSGGGRTKGSTGPRSKGTDSILRELKIFALRSIKLEGPHLIT